MNMPRTHWSVQGYSRRPWSGIQLWRMPCGPFGLIWPAGVAVAVGRKVHLTVLSIHDLPYISDIKRPVSWNWNLPSGEEIRILSFCWSSMAWHRYFRSYEMAFSNAMMPVAGNSFQPNRFQQRWRTRKSIKWFFAKQPMRHLWVG